VHAWVVSTLSAVDGPDEHVPGDLARLAERRAAEFLGSGDNGQARRVIAEALAASPDEADLLWVLADVEFADGDLQEGMRCLERAVTASGADGRAAGRQIRTLTQNRLWREALRVLEHVPAEIAEDPLLRTAAGDFYKERGCRAHAAGGYGEIIGLARSARARRRVAWLVSGGPFPSVRRRINAWENSRLLSRMRKEQRSRDQLDAMPDLDRRRAYCLKAEIESADCEWAYRYELCSAIFRWQLRLLPAACLPMWLVLYVVVSSASFLTGTPGVAGGTAISAVVALALATVLVRSQVRLDLTVRSILPTTLTVFFILLAIATASEIAVGEGYDHRGLPAAGLWAWVVFGLAVLPAVCVSTALSAAALEVLAGRWVTAIERQHCLAVTLEAFLSVLLDMQSPARQPDLGQRMQWSRELEWAARRITRDLLPSSSLSFLASGDWLSQRAAGWAEAVRHMQRQVIAPVPGSWPKLEAQLRHEIRCLATGDLGALPWRQPPPAPSRRKTLTRRAIEVLRTILVAALPIGAVLAGQAVLHFSSGVLRWSSIATGIWALLYVIISLDPAIRDKIDTARSLTSTLHDARKIG
jgi:tetratricopeptide (TPR) repeat protein